MLSVAIQRSCTARLNPKTGEFFGQKDGLGSMTSLPWLGPRNLWYRSGKARLNPALHAKRKVTRRHGDEETSLGWAEELRGIDQD